MQNKESLVSSEPSNGTSLKEVIIWMPVSPETCIQLSPEYAGQIFLGLGNWKETGNSPISHTTVITLDASCAKNLGMALTMEADQIQCPLKLRLIFRS